MDRVPRKEHLLQGVEIQRVIVQRGFLALETLDHGFFYAKRIFLEDRTLLFLCFVVQQLYPHRRGEQVLRECLVQRPLHDGIGAELWVERLAHRQNVGLRARLVLQFGDCAFKQVLHLRRGCFGQLPSPWLDRLQRLGVCVVRRHI